MTTNTVRVQVNLASSSGSSSSNPQIISLVELGVQLRGNDFIILTKLLSFIRGMYVHYVLVTLGLIRLLKYTLKVLRLYSHELQILYASSSANSGF